MRLKVCAALLALGVATTLPAAVSAGFDEGMRALQSGDEAKAVREFRADAEGGVAAAQYNLGVMLLRGAGAPKDLQAGLGWLAKAADRGDVAAMSLLGALYLGRGEAPQDYDKALRYLAGAAGRGDAIAQNNLAVMHLYGWGTSVDRVAAYQWATRAERGGVAQAASLRQAIAAQISPGELAHAERRLTEGASASAAVSPPVLPAPPPAAAAPAPSVATAVSAAPSPAAPSPAAPSPAAPPPAPSPAAAAPAPPAAPPVTPAAPPAESPPPAAPVAAAVVATEPAAAPSSPAAEPPAPVVVAEPVAPAEPAAEEAVKPAVAATAPASDRAAKPAAGFRAHIASVQGEADAQAEWRRISRLGKQWLSGMTPAFEDVDLGDKGRYVRIYVGAFEDLAAVNSFCDTLIAGRLKCRPVRLR